MKKLTKAQKKKFLNNLLRFSAPGLAVFFSQLALKVPVKEAGLVAILVIYGVIADYFKKVK
jgi:hypothetical protein